MRTRTDVAITAVATALLVVPGIIGIRQLP
jgi:hypothetical protein